MSRKSVALALAVIVLAGCSKLAEVIAPNLDLAVDAPSIVLADDTSQATAVLVHGGGRREPVTATWTSSDPAVISIGSDGRFVGHIEGRQATITAKSQDQNASATITVRTDDRRLAYLLADQPTATATYTPDANYSFNSSDGVNTVTRTGTGTYDVRFGGLRRDAGAHDDIQVSAYGTTAAYCKPSQWNSSGPDMVATVVCLLPNAVTIDSRFTAVLLGARPFGTQAPFAFVLAPGDTLTVNGLDSTGTGRNSTGGHIAQGHVSEGSYALQFDGMGKASASGPVGIEVSATGSGPRMCRVIAVDLTADGVGINCAKAGGQQPGDASFSFLWLTHGKPGARLAYAWADNLSASSYTPSAAYSYNSSGGAITVRRTGTGLFQVVFAGLARPAGKKEIVGISSGWEDFAFGHCVIGSWGTSGTQDLAVNVSCFHTGGGASNQRFSVYVIE